MKRKDVAGISLFLAVILASLLLVNLLLLAGAKNQLLITQAGTKLEQEAERALSLFDVELFDTYGLWGMREGLDEYLLKNLDVQASFSEIEKCDHYSYTLSEKLWKPLALKKQINQFMKARFPVAMANQLFSVLKNFKAASQSGELSTMQTSLEKPEMSEGFSEFGQYLEGFDAETDPLASKAEQGEEEEQEVDALSFLLMRTLQAEMQEATAAAVDLGVEAKASPVSRDHVFSYLNQANELLDFDTGSSYDKLSLNEYALRMFPSQVHLEGLPKDYPFKKTLRGKDLLRVEASEELSVESLITGDRREISEGKIKSYLFMLRFLVQNAGILMNQQKMASYRSTATTVSLVLAVVSLGHFNIPPDALLYVIVCIAAIKNATADVKALLSGQSVPYIPQHEHMKLASYYHDYLRLFLLTVSEENLLTRISQALHKNLEQDFYTAVSVQMEWKSPYFPMMEETFVTRRHYALYNK